MTSTNLSLFLPVFLYSVMISNTTFPFSHYLANMPRFPTWRSCTGGRERLTHRERSAIQRQQNHIDEAPDNNEQQDAHYLQQLAEIPVSIHVQEHQEQHYIGLMNQECDKCHAKYFLQEKTTANKFTKCCHEGKVALPAITPPSQQVIELFYGDSANSTNFRQHIQRYNNALAMASWYAEFASMLVEDQE